MSRRSLLCGLAALALLVWTAGPALAEHTHDGKVVSVAGEKLTTTCSEGKQHCHTMAKDAKVTCDGKASKAAETVKPAFSTRPATRKSSRSSVWFLERRSFSVKIVNLLLP